jgi:hypothetical protein
MRILLSLFCFLYGITLFAQKPGELWLAPACKPKLYGLEYAAGGVAAEAKYTMLLAQEGNAWIAQSAGKYGVINSKGEWLMRPEYEYLVQYSRGKAVCGKKVLRRNYEDSYYEGGYEDSVVAFGVIDESGTWIIDAAYDFLQLSDDGSVLYTDVNGKYGFLNPDGTILLRAEYDYASLMHDGVAVIANQALKPGYEESMYYSPSGRYSYRAGSYFLIDRQGTKLHQEPYDLIREPKEGRAAYNKGGVWKQKRRYSSSSSMTGGKWGFLDNTGKEVVAPVYDYVYDYVDGKAKVKQGEKTFWIDKDGKETSPPENKEPKGFKIFCEPGFYGYIDTKGSWFIEPQYITAEDFSEGLAAVMTLKASDMQCDAEPADGDYVDYEWEPEGPSLNLLGLGRQRRYGNDDVFVLGGGGELDSTERPSRRLFGYIDTTGNMVIPAKYETAFPFIEGRAYVCFRGKWGVIDRKGNWVFMPVLDWPAELSYDDAYYGGYYSSYSERPGVNRGVSMSNYSTYKFSEGMGGICRNNKYGFIDTTGKIIVAPVYDDVRPFSQGLAAVRHGNKWGYIDKTGREVISPRFSLAGSFTSDGLALIGTSPEDAGIPKTEEAMEYESEENIYYGFIDRTGKWVIKPQFTSANEFSEGLAAVEEQYGKLGYIDKTGKFVIPPKYDVAYSFEHGYAYVKIRLYEPVYIDKTGKVSKTVTLQKPPFNKALPLQAQLDVYSQLHGFINVKGEMVIPPIYDRTGTFVRVK